MNTLNKVGIGAVVVACYGLLPVWKENTQFATVGDTPADLHAALTLILGWLLVFRTNKAYDRWWEARTLWGQLVNASRNLSIKLNRLTRLSESDLKQCQEILRTFPQVLRDHLRGPVDPNRYAIFEQLPSSISHAPSKLINRIYEILAAGREQNLLDGDELRVIDEDLRVYLNICGGCERIRKTLIVSSYRTFSRQCVFLFLLTLPWGIVEDFGWWTPVLTGMMAYFMIAMEVVAEHIEEPFGYHDEDLNLDALCRTIATSVDELI